MKKTFEYETTCYIDSYDNLGGKLYLADDMYIDFDLRDIFVESIPQKISSKYMKLLEELTVQSPRIVSYQKLFEIYYGDDYDAKYDRGELDRQALRNFKTALEKYIHIQSKTNVGYVINLNKKIKKFKNVQKENIHDIRDLFTEELESSCKYSVNENDESVLKSLEFSKKFLHSGAQKLFNAQGDEILNKLSQLSDIFNYISTVDYNTVTQIDVIKYIYDLIVEGCHNNSAKDLLKIRGPLGSYKNRIMQYLYLAIAKNDYDILPFYIDIAFYERITESDIEVSEDDIIEKINNDFDNIKMIISSNHCNIPLLFLDGIRDFSRGNESLYYCISNRISDLDCKLVICLDADFTVNSQHQFNVHPLDSEYFAHYMRISSMSLHKKDESIKFIKNCINISDCNFPKDTSAEKVYENLVRLNFPNIDAYWLIYILKTASKNFFDTKGNISDLYTAICIKVLDNAKLFDSAAKLAYEFEFETTDLDNLNICYDIRWRLIRKHRSILDFLIAKHYAKKIANLKLSDSDTAQNREQLNLFNMIIQNHISKFAFEMLKGNEDYEHQIMIIAKKHYDELSLIGKSELTFRMTALKNLRRKQDCIRLIKKYTEEEKISYQNIEPDNFEEKKDSAFLLRSLFINLIYENDRDAFIYYFNLLLIDKLANSINRGFHLEYYGDKAYIPNKSLLDFEDDISKGKNTFDMLCLTLNERMNSSENLVFAAAIEVITLCNLIQARIEQNEKSNVFNIKPYIGDCLQYLEWIVKQDQIKDLSDVVMYFTWIRNELSEISSETVCENDSIKYYHATQFNKFSIAKEVERTGWVMNEIPEPENIVEHMYNCWLIGMLYLPDEYHNHEYNKNSILQMLLIHDLVEAKTGNINRPEREQKQDEYDHQENVAMQSLFLSGTYPNSVNLSNYIGYWNTWNRKDGINYYIAKDIDDIQTIFQFCHYYNQYPEKFADEDIYYWLSGINRLETDLGKDIAEKLITNNPLYSNIMELFSENNIDNN